MFIHERDFSNCFLGDNVYALAEGVIPEAAGVVGVELGEGPDPDALGKLVGAYGPNKELQTNTGQLERLQDRLSLGDAADMVERSGIQKGMARSLWTPYIELPDDGEVVETGGVVNWVDRGVRVLGEAGRSAIGREVHLAFGNRVMKSKTEVDHADVVALHGRRLTDASGTTIKPAGEYPTEAQYGQYVVEDKLRAAGHTVIPHYYPTGVGTEIAGRFVAERGGLFMPRRHVIAARVANAGVQLAVQIRSAAREHNPFFDSDPNDPQLFVLTDEFPLARTEAELSDPAHYQNPYTALRQLAVTAKSYTEAALADRK